MHERSLKRHMTVHNADQFVCGDCGKQYTQVGFVTVKLLALPVSSLNSHHDTVACLWAEE